MNEDNRLAIVVPCYNEQEVLHECATHLCGVLHDLVAEQLIAENSILLFVNDGSVDATWSIMQQLCDSHQNICAINLAHNVGHQNALMAGLDTAKEIADIAVSIDADLQDDITVIRDMVLEYHKGNDIVYGVRKARSSDTMLKRGTAQAFYRLMSKLGAKSIYNHADYRLMSRRALCQLSRYEERNLYLRGIVPLIGYNTTCVYYDRIPRFAGVSKYPLGKMINFAIDGITSFSVKPLRMITMLGFLFLIMALATAVYVLLAYLKGDVVSGWTSLIISLWFIGSLILIALGVVGEYIGKIYIEVKARPRYNIERKILK